MGCSNFGPSLRQPSNGPRHQQQSSPAAQVNVAGAVHAITPHIDGVRGGVLVAGPRKCVGAAPWVTTLGGVACQGCRVGAGSGELSKLQGAPG